MNCKIVLYGRTVIIIRIFLSNIFQAFFQVSDAPLVWEYALSGIITVTHATMTPDSTPEWYNFRGRRGIFIGEENVSVIENMRVLTTVLSRSIEAEGGKESNSPSKQTCQMLFEVRGNPNLLIPNCIVRWSPMIFQDPTLFLKWPSNAKDKR